MIGLLFTGYVWICMCVCVTELGIKQMRLGPHISQDTKGPSSVPSPATLLKLHREIYEISKDL